MCIRFGMVSMDTDVEELLALVTRTGTDLDEQVDHFQNMEEMVRKGIQQAQSDLQRESEEVIWQEGILRHVPLVGSIYNWISPAQKVNHIFVLFTFIYALSFYRSKIILDPPKQFGWVQFFLDGYKSFWKGPNYIFLD